MPEAIIGTSGWAYSTWKPAFYPAKLASKNFLSHYAGQLRGVEVNYSFRRFVPEKIQNAWIEATPPEFRFAVKAHQTITHIKRLKDAEGFTRSFIESLRPLASAGRLGPVLFQLPPFMRSDAALLRDFLAALPRSRELRYTFEFRHASWFAEEIYDVLRKSNAALCQAESEKIETPRGCTSDFCYYRFRKPEYSPEGLKNLTAELAAQLQAGRAVFAFFKHEETPEGALMAREVQSRLKS